VSIKTINIFKEDVNVFMVDWKDGAIGPMYLTAATNVRVVGPRVVEFLIKAGIDASKTHCIGHSLGAHVKIYLLTL